MAPRSTKSPTARGAVRTERGRGRRHKAHARQNAAQRSIRIARGVSPNVFCPRRRGDQSTRASKGTFVCCCRLTVPAGVRVDCRARRPARGRPRSRRAGHPARAGRGWRRRPSRRGAAGNGDRRRPPRRRRRRAAHRGAVAAVAADGAELLRRWATAAACALSIPSPLRRSRPWGR
eukprot:363630-Chlamydomonas_euryale.AAC.10